MKRTNGLSYLIAGCLFYCSCMFGIICHDKLQRLVLSLLLYLIQKKKSSSHEVNKWASNTDELVMFGILAIGTQVMN